MDTTDLQWSKEDGFFVKKNPVTAWELELEWWEMAGTFVYHSRWCLAGLFPGFIKKSWLNYGFRRLQKAKPEYWSWFLLRRVQPLKLNKPQIVVCHGPPSSVLRMYQERQSQKKNRSTKAKKIKTEGRLWVEISRLSNWANCKWNWSKFDEPRELRMFSLFAHTSHLPHVRLEVKNRHCCAFLCDSFVKVKTHQLRQFVSQMGQQIWQYQNKSFVLFFRKALLFILKMYWEIIVSLTDIYVLLTAI